MGSKEARLGRPPVYPWERWTNGKWHTIDPDKFDRPQWRIRHAALQHAHRNGFRVEFKPKERGRFSLKFTSR